MNLILAKKFVTLTRYNIFLMKRELPINILTKDKLTKDKLGDDGLEGKASDLRQGANSRQSSNLEQESQQSKFSPIAEEIEHLPPNASIDPDKGKGWLKRLWPLIKSQPKTLALGIIFSLLTLGAQSFVPYVSRWAIDSAGDGNRSNLTAMVIVIAALAIVRAFSGHRYRAAFLKMAFTLDNALRSQLYKHLTRLPFSFYDKTVSGEVISRANSDIRSIQILFAFAPLAATSLLVFAIALVLMFTIHIPLALVALSTIPLVYFLGNRFRDIVFPLSWVTQARLAGIASIVDESTNGAHVIKAFSGEREQVKKMAVASKQVRWSVLETVKARARYNPLIEGLPKLGMAAVLGYGGWLVIEGQVSIGTLFAFNAYVIMALVPFRMLGFMIIQARRGAAAAERVYEIIDTPVDLKDAPDAKDLIEPKGEISFKDVHFTYPTASEMTEHSENDSSDNNVGIGTAKNARRKVLDGANFTIQANETVAIVGGTGSGKSSIIRLLARFYDVDSGTVKIDGKNVRQLTQASIHHHIGIVFDDPFLFSTSLAKNIAFAKPNATLEEIQTAAKASQAHDFISNLPEGYETVIGERGYTLSGGQRQRVALARVLLLNPAVLALDDATSAVDVATEAHIHDYVKTKNSTLLIIAHRLSTISLADRILLLDEGRIADTGTHQELLERNPRYREILIEVEKRSKEIEAEIEAEIADEESGAEIIKAEIEGDKS